MVIFPLLQVVDDDGVIVPVSGNDVVVVSVKTLDGTAIDQHGAVLHFSGPNVSVAYDVATKGEAWITLAIAKAGHTFTGSNASPSIYLAVDSARVDVAISSRMDGSVRTGFKLAGDGLDAIVVEPGINARQALSPILAFSAGVLNGAGTGVIVIKAPNSTTTRITATTDIAGNRTFVTLALPT